MDNPSSDQIPINEVSFDSSSYSPTGDEIIDTSWEIYMSLEKKNSIEQFSKLKNIYDVISILVDVCFSGYISNEERVRIIKEIKNLKSNVDNEMPIADIYKKFESIIKTLKLSSSQTKALIIIDQIGITFFNEKNDDKIAFNKKIDPIKKMIHENANITKLHQVMHSIKCIDKLFNEDMPKELLPKKEILEIIDQLLKEAS